MRKLRCYLTAGALITACCALQSCAHQENRSTDMVTIGGEPVVALRVENAPNQNQPHFLGAEVLPGRGMNTMQIRAFLPGKGDVNLLFAPALDTANKKMDGGAEDVWGNASFSFGGALLLPYANRITGQLSPDGKWIHADIAGKPLDLPANWGGKKPGAQKYAMHGLILASKMQITHQDTNSVSASLHAGDFDHHWLSSTDVTASVTVTPTAFDLQVVAKNVGTEKLPIGMAWHPYFALPSGQRQQARLHLPAQKRALVNNYDEVLPTGQIVPVANTPQDFTAPGGAPLRDLYMDDMFVDLTKTADQHTVAEIMDPAAQYGLRITALSPEVSAIQVYAPPDKSFIVLEPQFNWAEPYSKIWKGAPTGMVLLDPGQSVTYHVRLELFAPGATQ